MLSTKFTECLLPLYASSILSASFAKSLSDVILLDLMIFRVSSLRRPFSKSECVSLFKSLYSALVSMSVRVGAG